jgi:secondary thiamine-phosphate synthase enzyme
MLLSMVATQRFDVATAGQGDTREITGMVSEALATSGMRSGIAAVCVVGSTASITTIEFEPGAVADLDKVLERLAPREAIYQHHLRWGDDNGSSHVRAALLGPSVTVPFVDGKLMLGTWQQIVLLEFDTRPRQREVVVQMVGE